MSQTDSDVKNKVGNPEDQSITKNSDVSNIRNESELVSEQPPLKKTKPESDVDLSSAFSRKQMQPTETKPSSLYGEEVKEAPAWLKSKNTDKYDKYGTRPAVNITRGVDGNKDERYSKYISRSSNNRVKRKSDDGDEDRYNFREPISTIEPEVAPYSNLDITNSAHQYKTFQSNIRNKDSRDINSIVRTHYNQRTHQSRYQGSRTNSPIYKLRNFNNAIKYILLNNFVKKNPSGPTTVLDLCCGKGGDLNKYEFVAIDQYIGIDISEASVEEAFSRYSRNKARFISQNAKQRDSRRYNFEACFATGDCFLNTVPEILEPNFPGIIDNLFPVDTVSIQFALHYSFETEEKARYLLTNVSKSLRSGGTFIGTMPSSDFIRDRILRKDFMDQENKKFGNDLYSVTFENETPSDGVFRPPFGHKYNYYLQDAIDHVPEYVVPFESFRSLCEDYGLTLKYKKNFIEIFNEEIPKYFSKLNKNLIEGMKRSDGKYGAEGSEKEAVAFYIGFVFEKLG